MPQLLADAWLHNLDPFAIQLDWFPGGGLRWYGLSYLAGFAVAFFLIRRVVGKGVSPMSASQVMDYVVTVAIGIVVGGRLGYVLFYQRELLTQFTGDVPFWGVFAINQGGMASHGGVLGGIAGCAFFAWRQKYPFAHMLDLMAFGGPIGLLFGRIANFINGELIGRECAADFPLAVKFPQSMIDWLPHRLADGTKVPADPRLGELVGGVTNNSQWFTPETNSGIVQFAIQKVQEGDPQMIAIVEPLLAPRYPSQLFAGFTEGVVVFAVLFFLYRKPVKPGLIGGAFCITYALMRVVNEFFRMPDSHLMPADGGMPDITRGQWLSFGLFVLGIVTVTLALRSKQDKLGGWAPRRH